uniref:Metalloendopeptidase n=1 Tax=Anopheles coluzzii TaxID=1518534 RepID=A0A8W7PT29_ANOCL
MVCGKETLFALGTLLLACCLLEWAEGRGATGPSLDVGQRLRALKARKASAVNGAAPIKFKPWEAGLGVYKEGDIMERVVRQRNGVALSAFPNARWPNAVVPENQVNLQSPECVDIGTVVHELMHSIGFYHEFTRPDRDEWVTIDQGALAPEYQSATFYADNYGKMAASDVVLYGRKYDYGSVMHYSKYAAAASRTRPVMNNLQPWTGDFGNDNGLSAADIIDINYMYCNGTTTTTAQAATTTTTARPATTTTTTARPVTTTTTTTSRAATTTTTTTTRASTTTTRASTTTTRAPTTTATTRAPTTVRPGIFTTLIQVPVTRFLEILRSLPLFNLFSMG